MLNPSQIARLCIGDLSDMAAHAAMAEKFRQQAIERLQELADLGETGASALAEVQKSKLYEELKMDLKHNAGDA